MFTSLEGRSVVVTGASKGIGKGIAGVFARAGASLVICGRDPEVGERAADELGARYIQADIAKGADCERLAAEVGGLLGDGTRLQAMAAASRSLARPDAARRIADEVLAAAR